MTDRFTENQLRQALSRAAESVTLPTRLQRPGALVLAAGERHGGRGRRALGMTLVGACLALVASVGLAVAGQGGSLDWLRAGLAADPQHPPVSDPTQVIPAAGQFVLDYPVDQPLRITSGYGHRVPPGGGEAALHRGVDFAVSAGDLVRAAGDGTVTSAGWMEQYGLVVIIHHGQVNGADLTTMYAHNSQISVEVGQVVRRGDLIALAGSTGVSLGPHLHFEVRVDGEPVDPMPWFPNQVRR